MMMSTRARARQLTARAVNRIVLIFLLLAHTSNHGCIIFFCAIQEERYSGILFSTRDAAASRIGERAGRMESRFVVFYLDRVYFGALITVRHVWSKKREEIVNTARKKKGKEEG